MGDFAHKVWVSVEGEKFLVEIEDLDQRPIVATVEGVRYEIEAEDLLPEPENLNSTPDLLLVENPAHSVPDGAVCEVTSPMPGDIIQILVRPGQIVQAGEPLCVLDAMKMKNTIHAPQAGVIAEVCIQEGQSVEYGTELFRFN